MRDLRDARRELRAAVRGTVAIELKVLATIPMTTGGEIRIQWYREGSRRPVISIQVFYPDGDGGWRPDWHRFVRFHFDELPELARGIAKALEEAEWWEGRGR